MQQLVSRLTLNAINAVVLVGVLIYGYHMADQKPVEFMIASVYISSYTSLIMMVIKVSLVGGTG